MNEGDTKPTAITSLSELQARCEKTINIEFSFDGEKLSVPGRRLRPHEDATLDEILGSVIPPVIRGKTIDDDRPDYTNAAFLKKKRESEIEARALGLYWCIPLFSAARPGLTNRNEITAFIQSQFNEQILSIFWQSIRNGGVTLAELVNFISPSGLAQS